MQVIKEEIRDDCFVIDGPIKVTTYKLTPNDALNMYMHKDMHLIKCFEFRKETKKHYLFNIKKHLQKQKMDFNPYCGCDVPVYKRTTAQNMFNAKGFIQISKYIVEETSAKAPKI